MVLAGFLQHRQGISRNLPRCWHVENTDGICGAVACYAFLFSIGFGKLSVGWLMMNISSAIPAVVSVFIYGEKRTLLKILALGLVLLSLYFIFRGRRAEAQSEQSSLREGSKQSAFR